MLSKNKIAQINQLKRKKMRDQEHCFIAEGGKLIADLCKGFECRWLVYTPEYKLLADNIEAEEKISTTAEEVQKISLLETSQGILAVFRYRKEASPVISIDQLTLVCDGIQNAGNLGTIIRVADWFGIHTIFLSENSVDPYNPKVVQATMGALVRVRVQKTDIEKLLLLNSQLPIYGAVLGGESLHKEPLSPNGILVLGNEGNGISPKIQQLIRHRIMIPPYPIGEDTSESLNVAIAAAILCYEFRRSML